MPRRVQKCRCCKCAGDCRRPYRVVQLPDGRYDPAMVPIEFQPGAIESRFQRYELWPGYNPACVWQVKSGAVRHLTFIEVFSGSFSTRLAIEELGLTYNTIRDMTALDATAAIEAAMSGYSEKQKAAWWRRALPFFGQAYDPADDYVPPDRGASAVELTQQGTRVVRGPFATPRHIVSLAIEATNSGVRPLTVDVLIGCDESGLSPCATVRLRLERTAAITSTQSLKSHVLTPVTGGWSECELVLELVGSDGAIVESATVANFPQPFDSPGLVTNNVCSLGDVGFFPVRLAFTNEGGLRVEAMISQRSRLLFDAYDTGDASVSDDGPPLRHLFAPLPGEHDISRIAIYLSRADNNTVHVGHRPLERNDEGLPDFIYVAQGPNCSDSDDAKDATAAGAKTICTAWSRSCHVTHSSDEQCYTELDVDLAGTSVAQFGVAGAINNADLAAVLQGAFTLGPTNAEGASLWHNSFWFHDDADVTVGVATRKRLEVSGIIGSHWPVPACIGDERPVEIALFARAIIRISSGGILPFGYSANEDHPVYAVLRCRVSQRLLIGEKRSPSVDGYYDGDIVWDLNFPWGTRFYDKAVTAGNTMRLNLTKCDFQLK